MSFEQGGITFYEPSDLSIASWNNAFYFRMEYRATNQVFHVSLSDVAAKFAEANHIEHYNSILQAKADKGGLFMRNATNQTAINIFNNPENKILLHTPSGSILLSSGGKLTITAPQGVWINGQQLIVP